MQSQQSARWSARPTRTGIRQATTPASYNSGLSCYTSGRIQSAYIKGNVLQAVVTGSSNYQVNVRDAGLEGLVGDCTCSYNSKYHGICKHVVAVLMHLSDHLEEMLVEEDTREATIKYMIKRVPQEDVLKFLANMMIDNEDARQSFIKEFGLENVRLQRDYRAEIDRMYRNAVEADGKVYTNLDFEGYFTNARESQRAGELDSATKMFRGMSEIISERMVMVDDSDGYYTDCFIEALENMVESIMQERLPHQKKREHIAYFLSRLVTENRPKFVPYYRNALVTICNQREDLPYWQEQLRPYIEKLAISDEVPKNALDLVLMQAHILEETGDHDEMMSFLSKFYHMDKKLCLLYLKSMHHMSTPKARKAAQAIVQKYPDDIQIIEKASEFYHKSRQPYAMLLRRMFTMTEDWKHFFKLKEVTKDWNAEMDRIIKEHVKIDPKRAVNIYLKEDMAAEAMKLLESLDDIDLFEAFRTKLSRRYSSRYFTAYGAKIIKEADDKKNRKQYEGVQKHLVSLKAIPGGEAKIPHIIESIKSKNSKKRALLELIEQV